MDFNFPQCAIFAGISVLLQTLLLCSTAASLEPYDLLYASGVEAFYRHDYENVVRYMEKALASYTELRQTKVQCRLGCNDQHPFDASFSDLAFFSAVLKRAACLNECMESKVGQQLSVHLVSGDVVQDFNRRVPYNYLQLAYYKAHLRSKERGPGGRSGSRIVTPVMQSITRTRGDDVNEIEKALECAWTYLLFHEGDEFITDNIEFYKEALAENNRPQDIRPRQDAERYVRRHQQELKVLLVGSDNLDFVYSEPNYWSTTFGREDINRVPSGTAIGVRSSSPSEKRTLASETDAGLREGGPVPYDEVQIVLGSEALNGSQRVLLDGVLSEQECRDLKSAAQTITMAGDGYSGKMSPHTPNEKFEGATYGYDGRIPLKSAQLFYEVSEKARRTIESYFMLNSTLYFSYTHLVCRTAIQGQQSHRNDLSHPIHADNCLLDTEAFECWKEPPAYTYRDYSAILYLNGDFDGGEFIFTEMDAKTVTASVKPNCGRMVGFSSGGENPHGVKAVTRGQRCAVAMWFTLDPLFRELERLQADEVMQSLDDEHRMDILNPRDEL
ncbi:Prolyl 3-hydroxylase 2 [Acipenser ruthenus]|uniref:procollagen-proline 3-dioxygenase n=1 Tax=Acipenser ruthenus TaxID=7906 RepID=A0A444UIV4_ACIRT|nr:Prolyl 3-hydroxylase 2 [Acipenser ruthenus]